VQTAPSIRIVDAQLGTIDCRTRLPFRFGIHTLTAAPYATAVVEIESTCGQRARGAASDLLVPKWFEKNPELTPEQDSANLVASAEAAFAMAREFEADTVFGIWHRLYQQRVASQPRAQADLLVRGFGVALLERALMDAVCRLSESTFHQALRNNLFGFDPSAVHDELASWDLASSLAAEPLRAIQLRHTVGLLDALTQADFQNPEATIDPANAPTGDPADGLPTTLEEDIRAYGLHWFKIKVAGRGQEDVDRLLAIAEVVKSCGVAQPKFTLDGNEQFADMAQLAEMLTQVQQTELGAEFLRGLAFIEQPLSRDHTFQPQRHAAIDQVQNFAPLIIDEADFGTWAFPDAIELGYRGISIKACKGVFRALLNRGICSVRNASASASPTAATQLGGVPALNPTPLFQSGEDLTNLPVRALQQDLCLMASLGIEHVERNGHHYFLGLNHLPASEASAVHRAHPDLYRRNHQTSALAIDQGRLNVTSLDCPGYGCKLTP
jgi:L-alanine-DL-glutamate epimerase-like enolase superfamily enzyme